MREEEGDLVAVGDCTKKGGGWSTRRRGGARGRPDHRRGIHRNDVMHWIGWRKEGEWILSKTVVNSTVHVETGVRTPRGATRRPASRSMGSSGKDLTSDGTREGAGRGSTTSATAEGRSGGQKKRKLYLQDCKFKCPHQEEYNI
jgi:hypothetical protein